MNLKLSVPSIGCASCIDTIAKAIQASDRTANITGDAATRTINIESALTEAQLRELIAIAGHEVA
ncbi:MAG: heavy metal transporter [Oscillatoriales cyanobacterium CG2_30_44_21]|nr:MAG: heavy metal transporter [Oscillatoriales cyanobacterium CG2_30_44_21]